MAKRARIRYANKTDIKKPHERITHVGGVNPDGKPWKRSIDEVVRDIESAEWEFYVEENGRRVGVVRATHNTSTSRRRPTTFNQTMFSRS
ncbi:DUF3892 domain-containing protein [Bradyrhizobium sp. AC87j1]|uniref:DUF3892 domain-containing protein n=1 Tax=Bradyrhizobium sp. AC87j1 TaxID=2055894 RepID=UPI001FE22F78|nr:DUF3892 domain-containing protein [Bradyrhizobium sp. AC87j1]